MPFLKIKDSFLKEITVGGLDIGTQAAKLVKLKFFKDQVELCDFKIVASLSKQEEFFKDTRYFKDIQSLNMSVCGPATIIRYVNFPRMNEEELSNALKFEAQKHIPFAVDEVNLDSYILKEDLSSNNIFVLLAAAKKESVKQRLKIIENSGLKVGIMDMDSIALINAFHFNHPKAEEDVEHKAVALLNIGAATSNLNVLEDGIPHLSRDIPVAGNSLTQKIADLTGTTFESAEELKFKPAEEKTKEIARALESVSGALAGEIRGSFDYYESQNASSVVKIFLSGGGAKFSGLKDALNNLLGIEVDYWDPFKKITVASNINAQELKAVSGQLAVAVGLALRR